MRSVLKELDSFITETPAFFESSAHLVKRYYRFLELIYRRYRRSNAKYTSIQQELYEIIRNRQNDSAALSAHFDRSLPVTETLQLECESFYVFGTILLDHVARFVEGCFGKPKKGRISGHRDLKNKLREYAVEKGLTLPDGLLDSITFLEEYVAEFRDKHIVHDKSWRSIALISWRPYRKGGISAIGRGKLYPKYDHPNLEQVDTKSPDELLAKIDLYIKQIIVLVRNNASRACLGEENDASREGRSEA